MAVSDIPVDVMNPGQVFACLGFAEAAEALLGPTESAFCWESEESTRFQLSASGDLDPIESVLSFLDTCMVSALVPNGSNGFSWKSKRTGKMVPTTIADGGAFPFPEPDSPATYPACLANQEGQQIIINYWGDATRRDNVKFWAGAGGYPGVALAQDAILLAKEVAAERGLVSFAGDPFSLSGLQGSSFRLDWRRDYVPLDAGFSPNEHNHISMQGYPLVELAAAIGLTNARPHRHTKLDYSYGIIGSTGSNRYDIMFSRLALGALEPPLPGVPFRKFRMELDWPGQENQARCIVSIKEEEEYSK